MYFTNDTKIQTSIATRVEGSTNFKNALTRHCHTILKTVAMVSLK